MEKPNPADRSTAAEAAQFSATPLAPQYAAWEEVDPGRYMPRRVRGSCQGRALG